MKINELKEESRYRVQCTCGPERKKTTWTGYARSKLAAAREATQAMEHAGYTDIIPVTAKKIIPSDYNITEGITEGWKGALGGMALAGAIGAATVGASYLDQERHKSDITINGTTYVQDQNAGPMSRSFDSEDTVINGKPARVWSTHRLKGPNAGTTHYYQYKDANNAHTFIMPGDKDDVNEEVLDELSSTHPHIRKELEKKGYKFLGKGVDQSAYSEPGTGKVLKIFGTQGSTYGSGATKLSLDQEMFIFWAEYCMKNANNSFLPKYDGFERFEFDDSTYFQIRMERLKKINTNLGEPLSNYALSMKYQFDERPEYYIANYNVRFPADVHIMKKALGEDGLMSMTSTCLELAKIANKKGWYFDLHNENFMARGKTPVIVDPWVLD